MFFSYVKISLRNLKKKKLFSFLNIIGLTAGLTCIFFISLYLRSELSYDRDYPAADRIYRVTQQVFDEKEQHWAATPPVLAESMKDFFPQVAEAGRLHYSPKILKRPDSEGELNSFDESEGYYADSSIADIFSLNFIKGNLEIALEKVNSIVLSKNLAGKIFGNENPIGETLIDASTGTPLEVVGVIEDLPATTHLKFDFLISMPTLYTNATGNGLKSRTWKGFYTYVLLGPSQKVEEVEKRMQDFVASFYSAPDKTREEIIASNVFKLQPVTDIHLHSDLEKEMNPNGNIMYVYIFSTAAVLILLLACINFINMSTVQAFQRIRDVGVRKVLGATKNQIFLQLFVESLIVVFISGWLVVFVISLLMPFYNSLTDYDLTPGEAFTVSNVLVFLLLLLAVSLITTIYPSLLLGNYKTSKALKGASLPSAGSSLLRKGLVVFQFSITVLMIISMLVIYRQMEFLQNKNLGFEKDGVVAVELYGDLERAARENPESFKNNFTTETSIKSASLVSYLPGERIGLYSFSLRGQMTEAPNLRVMRTDQDFLSTLKINVKEGNDFREFESDSHTAFILNEAAVEMLGIKNPVGQLAVSGSSGLEGEIVGVVEDFNFASLHTAVEPLIIEYQPERAQYLLAKVDADNVGQTLELMRQKVRNYSPDAVLLYSFLDSNLEKLYVSEKRVSDLFKAFTVFSLLISCLGLFGLAAYAAEKRTKEIGIRKVIGADTRSLIFLLTKDFMKLVCIAVVIGSPIAFYFMKTWLQNFAYRTEISWWIFIIAAVIAAVISFLTVGFHALKAATRNPVKNLRTE